MKDELLMLDRRVQLQQPVPSVWAHRALRRDRRVQEAEAEVEYLVVALDDAAVKIEWMERSLSWRVTWPLRVARDYARAAKEKILAFRGKRQSHR